MNVETLKKMIKLKLAGCVLQNAEGKTLLIHRNVPGRIQWELPGGKVEVGETSEVAAKREIMEELGVEVTIVKKLGEKNFKEDEHEMDYVWFLAKVIRGEPALQEEKYDDLRYFSWEEMQQEKSLSANAKNLFRAYKQGQLFI